MAGALLGLLGTGISMAGAASASSASKGIYGLEMQIMKQHQLQMRLEADRRRLETYRSMQRARSYALATATSQGAQLGSGLMGAYGQISGQGMTQVRAINQNEQIGENIFDLNQQIGTYKMQIADAQSQMALGQGISSLGGSLGKVFGTAQNIMGFGASPSSAPSAPSAAPTPMAPMPQMWWQQSNMMYPYFPGGSY